MTEPLTVLGLETSCDETAASVVRLGGDGQVQVLSSVIGAQFALHAPYGGVVPEIAARSHVETIDAVAAEAMKTAGLGYGDLTGVAATAGPGLVGGVMVGLSFGKAVALGVREGRDLSELSLAELQSFSPLIGEDVFACLTLEGSLAARDHIGGTAPNQVRAALARARQRMIEATAECVDVAA